jgi:hypothetical protein
MKTEQVKEMLRQFEAGILPKEQWTHEAHFIMALWYCFHQPLPQAIRSIREGIKKYNLSIGGTNTDHSGYHETITLFYTRLIIKYLLETGESSDLDYLLNTLIHQPFLTKDFPLKYYNKELLMSTEARKNWRAPDKEPLSF